MRTGSRAPAARQLAADLAEVGELWLALDPVPGGPEGGRRSPGWGSRSPARDDVIVLTDPRSDLSVSRALRQICLYLGLKSKLRAFPGVPGMITLLSRPEALESLSEANLGPIIESIRDRLRTATGNAERTVPIGPCPTEIPDPDGDRHITCSAPLRAPVNGDTILCRECGGTWDRGTDWIALGAAMRRIPTAA